MTEAGRLSLEELKALIEADEIDTVLLAVTDMQGRLQGKRCDAGYFLEEVVPASAEGCSYLLGVDVEMNTVAGYEITSWDRGYGDFVFKPDFGTLRRIPWHSKTAFCHADVLWSNGSCVEESPRQILRRQIARLAERGWKAFVGTELEFIVFRDSYEAAWKSGYRDLTPANLYNIDYSLLGTGRVEPLIRRIRKEMSGAGMIVESSKGECNLGQQEIAMRYSEALEKADEHGVFKMGAKEIAAQEGYSLTFMAKYNEREGNSCHVHLSLRDVDSNPVFIDPAYHGKVPGSSLVFEQFLAGQLATLRELSLLFAPNINSYKRFVEGSFAPTAVAWGVDNRSCACRVVGHGQGLRIENRVPGGDVNPYLVIAALIAGGLHGIENGLTLEPAFTGNAYLSDRDRVPSTLRDAMDLFDKSVIARAAFGDSVVDHYVNMARVEIAAFDAAVTDWERIRSFERL